MGRNKKYKPEPEVKPKQQMRPEPNPESLDDYSDLLETPDVEPTVEPAEEPIVGKLLTVDDITEAAKAMEEGSLPTQGDLDELAEWKPATIKGLTPNDPVILKKTEVEKRSVLVPIERFTASKEVPESFRYAVLDTVDSLLDSVFGKEDGNYFVISKLVTPSPDGRFTSYAFYLEDRNHNRVNFFVKVVA